MPASLTPRSRPGAEQQLAHQSSPGVPWPLAGISEKHSWCFSAELTARGAPQNEANCICLFYVSLRFGMSSEMEQHCGFFTSEHSLETLSRSGKERLMWTISTSPREGMSNIRLKLQPARARINNVLFENMSGKGKKKKKKDLPGTVPANKVLPWGGEWVKQPQGSLPVFNCCCLPGGEVTTTHTGKPSEC